ncbi:family 20 glycosylhydrolase [Caulobacter sp. NIBR2454]|uniref:family 20 glycosylhydrolase n=1 Tax=Caulobacter sp. NIBR2454 TaxID=3015996 RepID=UPI0022B60489|nr:family 20 glycosylhydrolase [Caulobacter sp. NIBR2454]
MLTRLLATAAFAALATCASAAPNIVPAPAEMVTTSKTFEWKNGSGIAVPADDEGARFAAQQLSDLLKRGRGMDAPLVGQNGSVRFVRTPGMAKESYDLTVGGQGAVITASDDAGLLYGAMSLWQMTQSAPGKGGAVIDEVQIKDGPRFAWRGLMVDSARHFQSVDFIKQMIDRMAVYKLNTLHWHLVDDQGWRLEIKKYPKLTGVGAWRIPSGEAGKAGKYGGFYTQDEVREVVAYAAKRNITIVPEIETPGHALAPIVAYPQLGSAATPPTATSSDWGVYPYLYNVDDSTFAFLQDVLDEVIDLFPSTYIHVGGDEAVKDQWKANPAIQAKIKSLGLKDEHELQSWFIQRLGKHLSSKGRRLIGWDEILEGGLAPDATVMSWRGIDGAVAAARAGHDTVLSPHPTLYFDNRQSTSPDEVPGRGAVISLAEVYGFNPAPDALTPDERKHVLGVQANLWAEHMRTEARMTAQAFPRVAAVAEVGWTPEKRRSWSEFVQRLPDEIARQKALGIGYNAVSLQAQAILDTTNGKLTATLKSPLPEVTVRYAVNGPVTADSPVYDKPLALAEGAKVTAGTFVGDQPLGVTKTWTATTKAARFRTSQQLKMCSDKLVLNLEDDGPVTGQRKLFLIDLMEPCWQWQGVDLTGIGGIELTVGQVPFNFQIGAAKDDIKFKPPVSAAGEFEVRAGGCQGEVVATLPLATATGGITKLTAPLKATAGAKDLCFTYTARGVDPMWTIDNVQLVVSKE